MWKHVSSEGLEDDWTNNGKSYRLSLVGIVFGKIVFYQHKQVKLRLEAEKVFIINTNAIERN